MKLSLSARIAEDEHIKDRTAISFAELADIASDTGYSGLCIRPSQATVNTPDDEIRAMRTTLDRYGLTASMVTLDPLIPMNTEEAARALRDIGRPQHTPADTRRRLLRHRQAPRAVTTQRGLSRSAAPAILSPA